MLGEVVTNIGAVRAPVNEELATTGAILNIIKVNVNGFGFFLNGVIGKTCGSGFVYTDRGRRLVVSDLGKGGVNGNGLLAVEKSGDNFCFGGKGYDIGKNLGKGEDGGIDGGFTRRGLMSNRGTITKEVIAAGVAEIFGLR